MPAPTDNEVLRAIAGLFRDLGGDPDRMPSDRAWRVHRAFKDLGAPPDVLALVGSWRDIVTNAELVQLIQLRTRVARSRASGSDVRPADADPSRPLVGAIRMG